MPAKALEAPQLEESLSETDRLQQCPSNILSSTLSHPNSVGAWWAPEGLFRSPESMPATVLSNKDNFGDIPFIDTDLKPGTEHQMWVKQYFVELERVMVEFNEAVEALRARGVWQDEAIELYVEERKVDLEELSLRVALASKRLHDGIVDAAERRGFEVIEKIWGEDTDSE